MNVPSDFKCCACGECCRVPGYVRISEEEADRIADYLGLTVRSFLDDFSRLTLDRRGLSLTEKPDASCIFLNSDNSCAINPVKPRQCASFPFLWSFKGWEDICAGVLNLKN